MTTKTQIQIVPEPMPLISHLQWMRTRLVDIRQAVERFNIAGKAIPVAWVEESELLKIEIELETVS